MPRVRWLAGLWLAIGLWTHLCVAADRTTCIVPHFDSENLTPQLKGRFPDEACGDAASSGWRAYMRVWKAHHADPANAEAIKELGASEGALGAVLGRLFALSEAYPDLKANENMMQFQEELASTENKVAFARQAFNDSVLGYNNTAENFPNNIIAGMFRFELASFLEIESDEKRDVPDVSCS